MAKLMDYCDGVQHIGIPAGDLAATCKFYEELGFENVHQAEFGEGPQHVCFLKYQNLVLECYDEANPVGHAEPLTISQLTVPISMQLINWLWKKATK